MNKTRLLPLVGLVLAVAAGGCSLYPPITGSGVLVEEAADLEGFSAVKAGSGVAVTLVQGDSFGVTVTVDDNILEFVRISKSGSQLELDLDPWHSYRRATLKAVLTMPVLDSVALSGGSSLRVAEDSGFPAVGMFSAALSGASSLVLPGVSAGTFDLDLSGASRASVGLSAATARFSLSGASRLSTAGSAANLRAEVSGASEADLKALAGDRGDLDISGGSRVWINLSGPVDVEISGGSTLYYRGSPSWGRLSVSGGSQLRSY